MRVGSNYPSCSDRVTTAATRIQKLFFKLGHFTHPPLDLTLQIYLDYFLTSQGLYAFIISRMLHHCWQCRQFILLLGSGIAASFVLR